MAVTTTPSANNNVYVHSSPPKAISNTGAAIRTWVKNGDVDKLESLLIEGQGARLLGLIETTNDPKVKTFLKTIPSYMARVDAVHDAVIRGSLRETQALLDKKKLALSKDAVGRSIAHKAVLYNHKPLLEWMSKKFPEVIHLRDNESRTPLHYTPASSSPMELYSTLINLGANPEGVDIHGRKPAFYVNHPKELDIEGPNSTRARNNQSTRRVLSRRISPGGGSTGVGSGGIGSGGNRAFASPPPKELSSTPPPSLNNMNPPQLNQYTRAQIRIWIHEQNLGNLEKIVWAGNGDKLLLETTNNSRVRRFLDNVPHLLSLIKQIHTACIHNDVKNLKHISQKAPNIRELFSARDNYGLSALHKAVGLGNREVLEYIAYEFPEALRMHDNWGRGVSAYCRDPGCAQFLQKLGVELEKSELDPRFLRNVPDAPRVSGDLTFWDRDGSGNYNSQSAEKEKLKRKISNGSFDNDNPSLLQSGRISTSGKLRRYGAELEEHEKAETLVHEEEEEIVIRDDREGKYDIKEDFDIFEGHKPDPDEEMMEVEQHVNETLNEPVPANSIESEELQDVAPPDFEDEEEEEELVKLATPLSHSPVMRQDTPQVNHTTNLLRNTPSPTKMSERNSIASPRKLAEALAPPDDFNSVDTSDEAVQGYIDDGAMETLVNLVLNGHGSKIIGKTAGPENPEVAEFLQNVPAYMAKISSIHSAAGGGNLRDLQSLLDRKRLAQARDEYGRVPLHLAVLGGHSNVVRFLTNMGSINAPDASNRTALHYAATLPDQGALYKTLIQSGADPNVKDRLGNTPGIYLRRRDLLKREELLNPSGLARQATAASLSLKPATAILSHGTENVDKWERPDSPEQDEKLEDAARTGTLPITYSLPQIDLPSKFVSQVRMRLSRNVRPHPFVSIMNKENLLEIKNHLFQTCLKNFEETWEVVDLENVERGEEREELISTGWILPEASKISRFWPRNRRLLKNNNRQIWINGHDHLDFIVVSQYGKLKLMMENLKDIYDAVSGSVDYHWNSRMGWLTVDPFRCGTGLKVTLRLRLPHLMKSRAQLSTLCDSLNLFIKWKNPNYEEQKEISLDDWIELENIKTFGLDENAICVGVAEGVNKLIQEEETLGREFDSRATKKKEL